MLEKGEEKGQGRKPKVVHMRFEVLRGFPHSRVKATYIGPVIERLIDKELQMARTDAYVPVQ